MTASRGTHGGGSSSTGTPCLCPCSTLEVLWLLTGALLCLQRRTEPWEDTSPSLLEFTAGPSLQ